MTMLMVWIGIGVAAVFLELLTPTALVSIWFAVGSAIAALVTLMHVSIEIQIACFVIVSIVSMLVVRPIASRYLRGNVIATNADRVIGEIGIVTKRITSSEWGEVKVGGTTWHASPVEEDVFEVQECVKIMAIEGAKLLVKRIESYQKEGK